MIPEAAAFDPLWMFVPKTAGQVTGCCAPQMDHAEIDIGAVRERLGLTQEQLAWRYGLDVSAIRNRETGRREPDPAALGALRVIDHLPDQVSRLLERPLGSAGGGRTRRDAAGVSPSGFHRGALEVTRPD
ncbi:MAG: helix-turn-helix domain-containing protein, partial [Parafilimonas terrae]|nr:helix-turn-helix domain-containing protein [Parafilimonas terrae]